MDDAQKFTCDVFHLDMALDVQPGFCAKRQRKAQSGDYCGICPIGIKAAKNERQVSGIGSQGSGEAGPQTLDPEPKVIKEDEMSGTGIKECVDCGKEYKPTSNVQKRCVECKAKKKPGTVKKQAGRQGLKPSPGKKPRAATKAAVQVTNGQHESVKVIETLVAIGAVSQAQVDATRKYLQEMFTGE